MKVMLIYFFDVHGIVHHEFVPSHKTVTVKFYLEVFGRLQARITQVHPDLVKKGWILHHDNAPAHSPLTVREYLMETIFPRCHTHPTGPISPPATFFCSPNSSRC